MRMFSYPHYVFVSIFISAIVKKKRHAKNFYFSLKGRKDNISYIFKQEKRGKALLGAIKKALTAVKALIQYFFQQHTLHTLLKITVLIVFYLGLPVNCKKTALPFGSAYFSQLAITASQRHPYQKPLPTAPWLWHQPLHQYTPAPSAAQR